jgi:hypothetical protein
MVESIPGSYDIPATYLSSKTDVCVGTIAQPTSIVQLCQVLQMSQLQQQPLCSKFCTQLQVPQACQLTQLLNPHPCLNLSHATQCVQPAQPL